MVGIYKITNKLNGKSYIGQSVNIEMRWKHHRQPSCWYDSSLYRAFKKYGIENFEFTVVEECSTKDLDEREEYWISHYNTYYNGYNETLGGQGAAHYIVLNKEKLQNLIIDLKTTSATNIALGKKYNVTDQTVSDINNGRMWYNEQETYPLRRKKVTPDIMQEFIPTKESLLEDIYKYGKEYVCRRYNVSIRAVYRWCKHYNLPVHKKDLKEIYMQEHNIEIPKPKITLKGTVCQCDILNPNIVIAEYSSTHEAGRALGDENYYKHIGEVCRGKRSSAYGFFWKYK